MPTPLCGRAPA
ncbi:unnamed protein product [Gulo gulo]|uniref:Uncharacterized protein n=1 Tax=Gulo gulo TaxID=48420 RepID=A0A9X9M8R4_GULGU|nr:unnamed protein product [Gulo gulo]